MANSFSFNRFKFKDIKLFCLILGGCYAAFGAFSSFIVLMQKWMISEFDEMPVDAFIKTMRILHEIWLTYMPFLVLIGIGYLLFGLTLRQLGKFRFHAHLILAIASLAWAISYSYATLDYLESFSAMMNEFPVMDDFPIDFNQMTKTSAIFGFVMVGVVFVLPQTFISIWTVKYEPTED